MARLRQLMNDCDFLFARECEYSRSLCRKKRSEACRVEGIPLLELLRNIPTMSRGWCRLSGAKEGS